MVEPRLFLRDWMARWLKDVMRGASIAAFGRAGELPANGAELGEIALIVVNVGSMPASSAIDFSVLHTMTSRFPGAPVVVLSDIDDFRTALTAIREGARGYIPMTLGHAIATAALRLVLAGGIFVPVSASVNSAPLDHQEEGSVISPIARRETREAAQKNPHGAMPQPSIRCLADVASVTPREAEVLACLRAGKQNKLIAHELNMRESTVKVHVHHLLKKLNATNRTQLALIGPVALARSDTPPAALHGLD